MRNASPKNMCYKKCLQKTNLLLLELVLFRAKLQLRKINITKYICTFYPGDESHMYDENDIHQKIKYKQDYFRKS